MTDMEAIRTRTSRRTYSGAISGDNLQELSALAGTLSEQSGLALTLEASAPALFGGFSSTYGMFKGVQSFFVLAGPESDEDLAEKAGYYGQMLVLAATKLGLGTCWVGGTFNKDGVAAALPDGQKLISLITVGPVATARTFKERALYSLVHRAPKPLALLYTAEDAPPAWFMSGVKATALAPSARAKQPVRFTWENGIATAFVPDESAFQRVDLGIAKLHFEIGAAAGKFAIGNHAEYSIVVSC